MLALMVAYECPGCQRATAGASLPGLQPVLQVVGRGGCPSCSETVAVEGAGRVSGASTSRRRPSKDSTRASQATPNDRGGTVETQYVGIDLHRRRSVIVRRTPAGETLETVRIANDQPGPPPGEERVGQSAGSRKDRRRWRAELGDWQGRRDVAAKKLTATTAPEVARLDADAYRPQGARHASAGGALWGACSGTMPTP